MESRHDDEFVENIFDLDANAVVAAVQRQRVQLKNPSIDVDRHLAILFPPGLVQIIKVLVTYRSPPISRPCWASFSLPLDFTLM